VQGYNNLAVDYFSNNDLEKALLTIDSLLVINPDYVNAILQQGINLHKAG